MPTTEKIKRPLIAHFLDTSQAATYSSAKWDRLGINVTDASTDYSPQTETEQDIVSDSASTEVTGYQPTMAVTQKCTKGDPVFEFVTKLRRNRATLNDANTWLLNVDLWESSGSGGAYSAEVQRIAVQVDSYGGSGGETPTQEFTINYIGDPIPGTVTITGGKPTFAASGS